jgi:hypothetical protein
MIPASTLQEAHAEHTGLKRMYRRISQHIWRAWVDEIPRDDDNRDDWARRLGHRSAASSGGCAPQGALTRGLPPVAR